MLLQHLKKVITYLVGKTAVKLHYARWLDLYALCSIHEPDLYYKSQRKARIPTSVRWNVWRRDHFSCVYCHSYGDHLTLDHKVAEEQGGEATEDNLLTACASCNQKKSNRNYEEFLKSKWLKKKRQHSPYPRLWTTEGPVTSTMIEDGQVTMSATTGKR